MQDTKLITTFITAWCWQILAMIFLCSSFIFIALPNTLTTNVFSVSFIVIFLSCEAMAIKRRKELYESN